MAKQNKKTRYRLVDKVYSGSIKCYAEQIADETAFTQAIKQFPKNEIQILAIKHNRDEARDGDHWGSAILKPHYHIIFRNTKSTGRVRFSTICNKLGVEFRKGIDDGLLDQPHTIETVSNFANMSMYLTHETDAAINDAKELYSIEEIISNLTIEEIEQVREGYVRVSANRKITQDELKSLDKEAFDMGYQLKDFLSWFTSLPFELRKNSSMRTIRESYDNGIQMRMRDTKSIKVNRLCIYIQGMPDVGKTYAANRCAEKNGLTFLVDSEGSGKFDKLLCSHNSIVISDQVCPNLLKMCDDYMCEVYKRNRNNPIWTGDLFIVTNNLPFDEWLKECGLKGLEDCWGCKTDRYYAMESRFFICKIDDYSRQIEEYKPGTRGTEEEKQMKEQRFNEIIKLYNETMLTYDKNKIQHEKYLVGIKVPGQPGFVPPPPTEG